jgi:ATP-dependent DNA helicase RecQ
MTVSMSGDGASGVARMDEAPGDRAVGGIPMGGPIAAGEVGRFDHVETVDDATLGAGGGGQKFERRAGGDEHHQFGWTLDLGGLQGAELTEARHGGVVGREFIVAADEGRIDPKRRVDAGGIDAEGGILQAPELLEKLVIFVGVNDIEMVSQERRQAPGVAGGDFRHELITAVILGGKSAAKTREQAVVVFVRVQLPGQDQLPGSVDFIDLARLSFCAAKGRGEQAGEDSDDGHDDQQLDERETTPSGGRRRSSYAHGVVSTPSLPGVARAGLCLVRSGGSRMSLRMSLRVGIGGGFCRDFPGGALVGKHGETNDVSRPVTADLVPLLKKHFGFATFRPHQREIIEDALAGRDVFAVLPTGGGKSLCYQLPAMARPGLTVVVSPLIALMKDQVDALTAAGVPATFLNSSLAAGEARPRLRGLHTGQFRLLYVAPERLMLSGFLEDLKRWNVALFAVDEAHCISEWGHDFRPEYRQLSTLRTGFPEVPMMALTATATERVREDIVRQLHLREPTICVASFNRPNLTYRVSAKSGAYEQVLEFIGKRRRDAGIIYVQSRKSAESLAAKLRLDGVTAAAYHAGLEAGERSRNQEAFLRDEVRVVCATIAFGMGINKPNVRFVIHYDLPKNIEGYYQETGRAGRDGLPSECLLLFSPGDVQKYLQFIDEKPDPAEQSIAREQLRQMVHYAEASVCRRVELMRYFGETYGDKGCGACDNCLSPRATYDGTLDAQKLLSCVYRIRQHSGFGVGINHVVDVLRGADTERLRRWGHETLSTYGIGKDRDKATWSAVARELVRLGYLRQTPGQFSSLELTPRGDVHSEATRDDHADPTRERSGGGETESRRDQLRRDLVRAIARVATRTGQSARRAALHRVWRCLAAADGAVLSAVGRRIPADQRGG